MRGMKVADDGLCPRCKMPLNREHPMWNALSRVDNVTAICSPCGVLEACWDLVYSGSPATMPPVDQVIEL